MDISLKRKTTQTETVRSPAVAGSFYPDSPKVLSAQVGKFIDDATLTETDGKLIGLIAPHAGYVYSGHVAGYAYKQLIGTLLRHGGACRVKPSQPNRHCSDLCAWRVPYAAWRYPNR